MATKIEVAGRWVGETVVCIASGPSLTQADCDQVRASGRRAIACCRSWERAPWADALYAMDHQWWKKYLGAVEDGFRGKRFTNKLMLHRYRVRALQGSGFRVCNNSGAGAIELARFLGASRILLLGYDQQHTDGKHHWHPDYPAPLGNARIGSIAKWTASFASLRKRLDADGVEYWNCTRETALDWPRMTLEDALGRTERPRDGQVRGDMAAA